MDCARPDLTKPIAFAPFTAKNFSKSAPLDENIGQKLAEWAKGGVARTVGQSNGNTTVDGITPRQADNISQSTEANPEDQPTEGYADDQDYKASQAANVGQPKSRIPESNESAPGGPSSVEGAIDNIYPPKSEKAPWNIVIKGIRQAVWKKTLPKIVEWLEKGNKGGKTIFRSDYTTEVNGEYTNHTCVNLQSVK